VAASVLRKNQSAILPFKQGVVPVDRLRDGVMTAPDAWLHRWSGWFAALGYLLAEGEGDLVLFVSK
jgi:hypothetical protein